MSKRKKPTGEKKTLGKTKHKRILEKAILHEQQRAREFSTVMLIIGFILGFIIGTALHVFVL